MGWILARAPAQPVTVGRYQGGAELRHELGPVAYLRPMGRGTWQAFVHRDPELGPDRAVGSSDSGLAEVVEAALAALETLANRPSPSDVDPESPRYEVGQEVEIPGAGPHHIRERQWHEKGGYWFYLLRKPSGAKVSKRYLAEDLEPTESET